MSLHMTHPHSPPDAGAVCRGVRVTTVHLDVPASVLLFGLYYLSNHLTKTVSASYSWRITAVGC